MPRAYHPSDDQVIHYAPAGDATGGYRTLPHSMEVLVAPLLRGGRAIFSVEQGRIEPMFRLLSGPKPLELYEGGHIAPAEVSIPAHRKWFDQTMGPVGQ